MLFDEDGYIKAIFLRDVGKARNSNKHNLFTLNYNKNKNASFSHFISALKNNKEFVIIMKNSKPNGMII